jgi:hypothetical protein
MSSALVLLGHIILLGLASTSFTIVSAWRGDHVQWEYFRYASQSGWGTPYQFPYTLPVVLTYVAAYAVGVAGYLLAWRHGSQVPAMAGVVLCGLGCASFAFELTHWVTEHYRSWIVSQPAAAMLLAAATMIQQYYRPPTHPVNGR